MSKTKKIVLSGLLLAILIVFSRFLSIKTQYLVVSFSFIPIIISAIWLGPKYSMIIAGLGDLIGALLFPFGAYFPGFTLSAAISGLIYGLLLYQKPDKEIANWKFILRLIISSILVLAIVNIFINSYWLHLLYGSAYLVVLATRVTTQCVMLPIQIVVIFVLDLVTRPIVKRILYN